VVEGPTGSLDARLEMQLECLREALLEARKSRRQDEEAL
jgi:flagellar biosynthesis/type III secretory pathway protein FliH